MERISVVLVVDIVDAPFLYHDFNDELNVVIHNENMNCTDKRSRGIDAVHRR